MSSSVNIFCLPSRSAFVRRVACASFGQAGASSRASQEQRYKAILITVCALCRLISHGGVVSNLSQTGLELVSNWSRTGFELVLNWSRTGLELVSNWFRTGPKLVSTWSAVISDYCALPHSFLGGGRCSGRPAVRGERSCCSGCSQLESSSCSDRRDLSILLKQAGALACSNRRGTSPVGTTTNSCLLVQGRAGSC